jgi:hypothetical protein
LIFAKEDIISMARRLLGPRVRGDDTELPRKLT